MSLTAEQLEERRKGVGGSDVGALLGLDPYRTIWDVWESKVLPPKPQEDNADTLRGKLGEPVAAAEYARRYGVEVVPAPEGMVHPELAIMRGNPDRLIVTPEGPIPLEIKCPRIAKFYEMKEGGLSEPYILQLQHYMAVGGWERGVFAIWCGEYSDLYAFEMARDEDIVRYLVETERRFWEEYVIPRKQPPHPLPEPTLYPNVLGEAEWREDNAWREAAQAYTHFHYEAEEAVRFRQEAEERLLAEMGEESTHVTGAGVSVKRSSTSPQRRWNAKRFKAAYRLWLQEGMENEPPDPEDDDFYYQTQPRDRVDIKVLVPEEEALTHA